MLTLAFYVHVLSRPYHKVEEPKQSTEVEETEIRKTAKSRHRTMQDDNFQHPFKKY